MLMYMQEGLSMVLPIYLYNRVINEILVVSGQIVKRPEYILCHLTTAHGCHMTLMDIVT